MAHSRYFYVGDVDLPFVGSLEETPKSTNRADNVSRTRIAAGKEIIQALGRECSALSNLLQAVEDWRLGWKECDIKKSEGQVSFI